jgi:glucose/arabinose dehydrogenase
MRLQPFCASLAVLAFLAGPVSPASAQLRVQTFVSGLSSPVAFVQDPGDATVQYVVEQAGRIKVVSNGVLQATPFLDIASMIAAGGEQGLLGLAFPPNYSASGRFYVFFTNGSGDLVVARFTRSAANRFVADRASRFDLRWSTGDQYIEHSARSNHNGGCLAFGPDGMLYITTGDGGGGGDPDNNAQNISVLLGKILRVDVVSAAAQASPSGFVVPPGNAGLPRAEIWSLGWRNPWRFSFDLGSGGTGAMIVGDVGQGAWEEIDYEPANRPGRNYGWDFREGTHAFSGTAPAGLTNPIFEYSRSLGASVTGGYVYRGSLLPEMRGRYFFGDYVFRRIYSIGLSIHATSREATATDFLDHTSDLLGAVPVGGISAFGVDAEGELYIVDHTRGLILKFVRGLPRPPTNVRIVRE